MKYLFQPTQLPTVRFDEPLGRRGLPIYHMKKYQLDSIVAIQLEDIFEVIEYRRQKKLPNFGFIEGDSGKGKTGFVLQFAKLLNEKNNHTWDVKHHVILATDAQITGGFITANYDPGETVVVDEFSLIAPKYGYNEKQLRDIIRFYNTIRSAEIELIGISQYLDDLHPSVHNRWSYRVQTTYCDPGFRYEILGLIEIPLLEEGGKRSIDWLQFQRIYCGFGDPADHAYVERLKGYETRTEESEQKSYADTTQTRLLGFKEERSTIVREMLRNEEIEGGEIETGEILSAEDIAFYVLLHLKNSITAIQGALGISSSARKARISFIKQLRAGFVRQAMIPARVQMVLDEIDKRRQGG